MSFTVRFFTVSYLFSVTSLFFLLVMKESTSEIMLRGIDPMLTPELLHAMRSAGHGDAFVVCDCNFPATSVAKSTTLGAPILLAGAQADAALDAICTLLPVDLFEETPICHMAPAKGDSMPPEGAAGIKKCCEVFQVRSPSAPPPAPVDRFAFYELAKKAFVVIQCTGERRPYVNFIIKKGVIGPDGNDLKPR